MAASCGGTTSIVNHMAFGQAGIPLHYQFDVYKKLVEEGKKAPIYHTKSRPNLVEAEAVERVLKLARMAGDAPVYIVHLSCKESLEAVREARRNGQKNIFVETCPQYLLLTEECYEREDGLKYIMSPPLRTQADCDALWEGLADGTIQVVASDHCPFNYGIEKQMAILLSSIRTKRQLSQRAECMVRRIIQDMKAGM